MAAPTKVDGDPWQQPRHQLTAAESDGEAAGAALIRDVRYLHPPPLHALTVAAVWRVFLAPC
jgi:hypothetical protein